MTARIRPPIQQQCDDVLAAYQRRTLTQADIDTARSWQPTSAPPLLWGEPRPVDWDRVWSCVIAIALFGALLYAAWWLGYTAGQQIAGAR